jgi:hypothetical protein
MTSAWTERHEQAQGQVREGRRVIDCQRVMIATRKALGESTVQSEELLATFENSQADLECDLIRIRGEGMNLVRRFIRGA